MTDNTTNTQPYHDAHWYWDDRFQDWLFVVDRNVLFGSKCVGVADDAWLSEHPTYRKSVPSPAPIKAIVNRTEIVAGKRPPITKKKGGKNVKSKAGKPRTRRNNGNPRRKATA